MEFLKHASSEAAAGHPTQCLAGSRRAARLTRMGQRVLDCRMNPNLPRLPARTAVLEMPSLGNGSKIFRNFWECYI
jgi:hypothetical protein